MTLEAQRAAALALLATTGMRQSNYLPPAVLLLWRLGINVPLPHFARFVPTVLTVGGAFAVGWGLIMWLVLWRSQSASFAAVALQSGGAGLVFGLVMATYYAYGRRKYRLPPWDSFADATPRT